MSRRAAAAASAVLLLVTGCATLPEPAAPGDWDTRRAALQALDRWTLSGRVAVAAGDEGFSGGLTWSQSGTRAEVNLRGPVGGSALAIRVDGSEFTVTDQHGDVFDGDRARELVARRVGSDLPISELRYWLVGAPAPGAPHRETLGADARLATLDQAGWQVRYDRYRMAGTTPLPARLDITKGMLRLRVAVQDWQLAP
ncbi:MAG TPA: lipoprotein insertase outer membrane protein LolB [Steroidobacteraceae bacterium]|nr:lipoprotein insertase outer membrane protein LolB [Steroidobacteraceae bacterium]